MLYWTHARKKGQLTRGSWFKFADERDYLAKELQREGYEVTVNVSTDRMDDFSPPLPFAGSRPSLVNRGAW